MPATTKAASVLGGWVKAMKELKNSAPSKTKKIMPEVTAVLLMTSARLCQLKSLWNMATKPVPAAPMAAPSVGVNQPR